MKGSNEEIENIKKLEIALRELLREIYGDCHGAYGGDYDGQWERELQDVLDVLRDWIKGNKKNKNDLSEESVNHD